MRDIVIVGAGFAGVSTAYHLARRGVTGIQVLEREVGPGFHASGKNAGLLRQSSHDPALVPLLRRGSRAAAKLLRRIPGALRPCGSLILGASVDRLRGGPRAEFRVLPELGERGLFDPDDAVVDPMALLGALIDGARRRGVRFVFEETVEGVSVENGRVVSVRTQARDIAARGLVVAAGAWSAEVAALAGSAAIDLAVRRRHLFRGRLQPPRPGLPFVWHESKGVYFRAEGEGMLLSPCDTELHPAAPPQVDPAQRDVLAERVQSAFGGLGEWSIGAGWACLRTFAPDERFVIGPDPGVGGLFWVTGLGGHGMTAAWAVGRLAARVYLARERNHAFDPARFL